MAGLDDVDMNDLVQAEGRADRQSKVDIGAEAKVVTAPGGVAARRKQSVREWVGRAMHDRVLRMRTAALVRLSKLGFSRHGGMWGSMALACALLAGCAGGSRPPLTADQIAAPKADPAATQATADGSSTPSTGLLDASPALLQRRRQAIAEMLEALPAYRNIFWAQLIDAKLAGPLEHTDRSIFTTASRTSTIYCASAGYSVLGLPSPPRIAVIRVTRLSNGFERLESSSAGIFICNNPNYGPFPELEQARAERRKRMGKSD